MSDITFSQEEKDILVQKIKLYFHEELDYEIGGFDAEFLLDFFKEEMGAYFYNRGVYDAQALLSNKVEELTETLFELEKSTDFVR